MNERACIRCGCPGGFMVNWMNRGWEHGDHHKCNEARLRRLLDAVDEYALWEPGRKGHAAAHRKLLTVRAAVGVGVNAPERRQS